MRFEQTRDVLDHARQFHAKLSQFYRGLVDSTEQEQVKLLLKYMSRHEKHLAEALQNYQDSAAENVMNTWFDCTHDDEVLRSGLNEIKLEPDMTVDDVIALAMRMDDRLITLYREIADEAVTDEIREVFQCLLKMEEQEKIRIARQTLRMKDL